MKILQLLKEPRVFWSFWAVLGLWTFLERNEIRFYTIYGLLTLLVIIFRQPLRRVFQTDSLSR